MPNQPVIPVVYGTFTTTCRYPLIDYCPAGDPGHTINVSPVEPSPVRVIGLRG